MTHKHRMQGYQTGRKINNELINALTGRLRVAYRTHNKTHADQLEEDIRRVASRAQAERIIKKLRKECP